MFNRKSDAEIEGFEKAITEALSQLDAVPAYSNEYNLIMNQIERLHRMKDVTLTPSRVTPDTLAIVIGNLAGIAIIVGHERAHVVTSKALGFIMKASR